MTCQSGIKDPNSFRDFGVGYANGSLLDALSPEGNLLADLKALGILTLYRGAAVGSSGYQGVVLSSAYREPAGREDNRLGNIIP